MFLKQANGGSYTGSDVSGRFSAVYQESNYRRRGRTRGSEPSSGWNFKDVPGSGLNDSVLPSRWGSMWRYAAGLYLAHFAAMYLKTYSQGSSGPSQAAAKAQPAGVIKSATMGDTTVSYDNSAVTIGTEKWGSWNATQYGQQLATLARQVGMGGMYVI